MEVLKILFDPAILIVLATFFGIVIYYTKKVKLINNELLTLLSFLKKI